VAVGEDGGDEGGDGGRGGEVCGVDFCGAAEGFDVRFGGGVGGVALWVDGLVGCGEGVGWTDLDEEDVCACFGEGDGHCLAYSSCAACYEGRLALEGEEFLDGGHVVVYLDARNGGVASVSFKREEWESMVVCLRIEAGIE